MIKNQSNYNNALQNCTAYIYDKECMTG